MYSLGNPEVKEGTWFSLERGKTDLTMTLPGQVLIVRVLHVHVGRCSVVSAGRVVVPNHRGRGWRRQIQLLLKNKFTSFDRF